MSGKFNMDDFACRVALSSDPTDCVEWQGARHPAGYGQFRGRYAHWISWALNVGEIPAGMCVLHHCDNPPCVNPAHLFLGTRADNVRDMRKKDRNRTTPVYGEKHGRAVLSWNDVQAVRRRRAEGLTLTALANQYGVSITTVHNIVTGKVRVSA